jgi:hypothetical protein
MDTSTPAGKMVFTVLGAVAKLERSLIGVGSRELEALGIALNLETRIESGLLPQALSYERKSRFEPHKSRDPLDENRIPTALK